MKRTGLVVGITLLCLGVISATTAVVAAEQNTQMRETRMETGGESDRISLTVSEIDIADIMTVLARQEQTNIMLSKDVAGTVSINLYDVTIDEATLQLIETPRAVAIEPLIDALLHMFDATIAAAAVLDPKLAIDAPPNPLDANDRSRK